MQNGKDFVEGWEPVSDFSRESSHCLVMRPGSEVLIPQGSTTPSFWWTQEMAPETSWSSYKIGTLGGKKVVLVTAPNNAAAPQGWEWVSMRVFFLQGEEALVHLLGRAAVLTAWNDEGQFCGRCGAKMQVDESEPARVCPQCSLRQYPRLSPAVIMRITDGKKILLARNRRFPGGLYSSIAGFVDAGECAEDAVVREAMEEVGLEVGQVRYLGSQCWPFPHSLMLAFSAEAQGLPEPDGVEIVDAQWFDGAQLPELPKKGSISRWMIDSWLEEQGFPLPHDSL